MLDFLKTVNISDTVLKAMEKKYDSSMLFNLNMNAENCIGIILYMQKIGIKNVNELLLNKPEWFLKTTSDFIATISLDANLIKSINEDFESVSI